MLNSILNTLLQLFIVVIFAPLPIGIIKKLKAASQHRIGAPVLQQYFDLLKLFRKDVVISNASSWVFRLAPYTYLISILAAALFIPVLPRITPFAFTGDAIMAVYLLALGRFFIALSGLDTGSTFGGMGSSRDLMISSLIEPSLIIILFSLGLNPSVASTSFTDIFKGSAIIGAGVLSPAYMLLLGSLVIILLAETARIPVDDPATHLELTMVHEAMVLEYSGRYLAMIQLASVIKQLLYATIIANVFIPFGNDLAFGLSLVIYLVKIIAINAVIGLLEIGSVKLRLFSVPNLAALAFILSMLGFLAGFIFGR